MDKTGTRYTYRKNHQQQQRVYSIINIYAAYTYSILTTIFVTTITFEKYEFFFSFILCLSLASAVFISKASNIQRWLWLTSNQCFSFGYKQVCLTCILFFFNLNSPYELGLCVMVTLIFPAFYSNLQHFDYKFYEIIKWRKKSIEHIKSLTIGTEDKSMRQNLM